MPVIIVVGTSTAEGCLSNGSPWPELLRARYAKRLISAVQGSERRESLVTVLNKALSGVGSELWCGDLEYESDRIRRQARAREFSRRVFAIVQAGCAEEGVTPDDLARRLASIYELSKTGVLSGPPIFMNLPLPQEPLKQECLTDHFDPKKRAVLANFVIELAQANGWPYVDVRAAFAGRRDELYAVDGAHPNAEGHQVIADLAWPVVDKVIERNTHK